jgi:6-phosphofructokinase 1
MAETSTRVFILETMGRHAGWIAAASALARDHDTAPPHVILLPEVPLDEQRFLDRVRDCVARIGYCVVVVSEGLRRADGAFVADQGTRDAFGHAQLGGVAPAIAGLVREHLGYKYHYAIADYLQRAARHIAAATDVEQAYQLGRAAVDRAVAGENAVMPTIVRESDAPYRWHIGQVALEAVANREAKLPAAYISDDGLHVTEAALRYLRPLIAGEDYPPYTDGLPEYARLRGERVAPRCPPFRD